EQHQFIRVTDWDQSSKKVNNISYYLDKQLADGVFNSCIEVQMPSGGIKVLPTLLCQSENCTTERLFQMVGKRDPSPMQINFHYEISSAPDDDQIVPNHLGYTQCNAVPSSYSQYACSCTDCSLMCPKPKPI